MFVDDYDEDYTGRNPIQAKVKALAWQKFRTLKIVLHMLPKLTDDAKLFIERKERIL